MITGIEHENQQNEIPEANFPGRVCRGRGANAASVASSSLHTARERDAFNFLGMECP